MQAAPNSASRGLPWPTIRIRQGHQVIEAWRPALTKLITAFALERYEIASGHAPEYAAAGRKPPWRYDAVMLQSMRGGSC